MSTIVKFSRKALREKVSALVTEMEDEGSMIDDTPGANPYEVVGPDDATGLKGVAAQACTSLHELIKQASAVGVDTSDYNDMIDQIHADFQLPGGTADVQ